jgi:phospholipid N-methyltransferase
MDHLAPEYPQIYPSRIRRIIPWYEELIDTVVKATTFISESRRCNCRAVLEMGLGDGYLAQRLLELSPDTKVLGVEISQYVCKAVESRLDSYRQQKRLFIFNNDINEITALKSRLGHCCKVITCSLLLHDIPPERRQAFLQDCYDTLSPTGSMVLADVMLTGSEFMDQLLVNDWIKSMQQKGTTLQEIEEMKADDPFMFKAATEEEIVGLLYTVGFKTVRTVWRNCNFAVIIANKADKHAVCGNHSSCD